MLVVTWNPGAKRGDGDKTAKRIVELFHVVALQERSTFVGERAMTDRLHVASHGDGYFSTVVFFNTFGEPISVKRSRGPFGHKVEATRPQKEDIR